MPAKPSYEELERRVQALEKLESDHNHSKKALQESERLFKILYENSPFGYQSLDGNGRFIVVNQTWLDILGYTREEVIGKSFTEFLHPDWRDHFKENFPRFKSIGEILGVEFEMVKKNGDLILVSFNGKIGRDQDGRFLHTHCILDEITERRWAEKQLKESEEKFTTLIQQSPFVVEIYDLNGLQISVNKAYEELWDFPAETTLNKFNVLESKEVEETGLLEYVKRAYAGDSVVVPEYFFDPSGDTEAKGVGRRRWLNTRIYPLKDESGKVKNVVIVHQDITERKQSAEALRESEAKFRAMVETFPLAIHQTVGVEQITEYVNPTMVKLFGYTRADIPSVAQWWPLAYPDETYRRQIAEEWTKKVKHAIATQSPIEPMEVVCTCKDGSKKNISWGYITLGDKNYSCGLDITERKQAEEALKLNYSLLQIAGETAIFGGWSVDLEKNICTWSDAVADIHDVPHGYSPFVQEAINFYAPKWREKITQCFSACVKEGNSYDEEMEIITQKGKHVWVRTTGKAVRNEKDKIIKVQGSFQDITDKKQTEEDLRESEEKLQALFSAMTEMVVLHELLFDDKGMPCNYRILDCNQAFCRITKIKKETAVGKTATQVYNTESAPYLNVYDKVALSGEPVEFVTYYASMDKHFLVSVISPRKNFFATITSDITEIRRAEAEREKLQAQLHQAQKMESVGRLAGGVAHDFNNMLSVILGHTEMALDDVDPATPLHASLQAINYAAERSATLTRQLLAFARKQTIAPKVIDINETVAGMLNMLRRLIGEDIDLLWQPGRNLKPIKVDPSQVDQLLANLCVNARDAIAGVGKITIVTDTITLDEAYCADRLGFVPGEYILLKVIDDGCGMAQDTLNHIFEPFFTTKEQGKGTGLGLASVLGMVKQNNGFINVESESGQGTTFTIYLPAYAVKSSSVAVEAPDLPAECGNETILLVEDEPAILEMTTRMLTRLGYTVVAAATPGEAIRLALEYRGRIDLLITDVVMPEMNGRELAGNLLSHYPDLKRLFMSGYTANVIAHHGVLDEGVNFIQKPFSMKDLGGKLRQALEG